MLPMTKILGAPVPKIAVIEDDPALNESHCELLRNIEGAELYSAHNTFSGRELIAQGDFDLVVLDIELDPHTSTPRGGLELLYEFGEKITTIIVTGMPEPNLHEFALTLKAFEFVRKPVNPADLLNKARHALTFKASIAANSSAGQTEWPPHLTINPSSPPHVKWRGEGVNLTMTELTLVHRLANAYGSLVTYGELANALKSGNSPRVVTQHMSGVRGKFIEVDPDFDRISVDGGKGYLWRRDDA